MEVKESVLIEVPLERAWPVLKDVDVVVACLPGARLDGPTGEEGEYAGALEVRMGPTRASFSGRVQFVVDGGAHRVDISGRGQDARGRTRASVAVAVTADEAVGDVTRLSVEGSIDVVGALERFAATGGAHLAKELMAEFASNLASHIEGQESGATVSASPDSVESGSDRSSPAPPTHSRPLSVGRLIWLWLRRLFGRSNRRLS